MFDIITDNAAINKGRLYQVIIDFNTTTPNADVQYQEGYINEQGDFISLGINKVHLQDRVRSEKETASSEYTEFISMVNATLDVEKDTQTFLLTKLKL